MLEVAIPILIGGILAALVVSTVEKKKKLAVSDNSVGKEVKPE